MSFYQNEDSDMDRTDDDEKGQNENDDDESDSYSSSDTSNSPPSPLPSTSSSEDEDDDDDNDATNHENFAPLPESLPLLTFVLPRRQCRRNNHHNNSQSSVRSSQKEPKVVPVSFAPTPPFVLTRTTVMAALQSPLFHAWVHRISPHCYNPHMKENSDYHNDCIDHDHDDDDDDDEEKKEEENDNDEQWEEIIPPSTKTTTTIKKNGKIIHRRRFKLNVDSVEIQSVDMFGSRVGFIKMHVDCSLRVQTSTVTITPHVIRTKNKDNDKDKDSDTHKNHHHALPPAGEIMLYTPEVVTSTRQYKLPGICFLRGHSVSLLVALFCPKSKPKPKSQPKPLPKKATKKKTSTTTTTTPTPSTTKETVEKRAESETGTEKNDTAENENEKNMEEENDDQEENRNDDDDDDEAYMILVDQPRIPIGSIHHLELPAGMVEEQDFRIMNTEDNKEDKDKSDTKNMNDDIKTAQHKTGVSSAMVVGTAMRELQEECHISALASEWVDLTALAYPTTPAASSTTPPDASASEHTASASASASSGVSSIHNSQLLSGLASSPGGCDECIHYLYLEKRISRIELKKLQNRETGVRRRKHSRKLRSNSNNQEAGDDDDEEEVEGPHNSDEPITLRIVPFQEGWRIARNDSKVVISLFLLDQLRQQGVLPPAGQLVKGRRRSRTLE